MIDTRKLGEIARTLGGIPVWGCLPGSVAAIAGIRYGDIVLQVNGVETRTIDEYLSARALRTDGVEVVFHRDGTEHRVDLVFGSAAERDSVEETANVVLERGMMPTAPASSDTEEPN